MGDEPSPWASPGDRVIPAAVGPAGKRVATRVLQSDIGLGMHQKDTAGIA